MSVIPCPCPCPIATELQDHWGFTVDLPQRYLKPGDIINSPYGSYQLKVESYPFSRIYNDFRGDFESCKWDKFCDTFDEFLGDSQDLDLCEAIFNWASYHRNQNKLIIPTIDRLLNIAKFLALFSVKNPSVFWYLAALLSTTKPMPHKDNLPYSEIDKRWIKNKFYPASYLVTVVGYPSQPKVSTPRWDYFNFDRLQRSA